MSVKITKEDIIGSDTFNILEFEITTSGITDQFVNSNCTPASSNKSTYSIKDCTTIDCNTINCTTIQCNTVNCTTIDCTTVQCNTVQCKYQSYCVTTNCNDDCDCNDSD